MARRARAGVGAGGSLGDLWRAARRGARLRRTSSVSRYSPARGDAQFHCFRLMRANDASSAVTRTAAAQSVNTETSTRPARTDMSASVVNATLVRNTRATISGTLRPLSVAL